MNILKIKYNTKHCNLPPTTKIGVFNSSNGQTSPNHHVDSVIHYDTYNIKLI